MTTKVDLSVILPVYNGQPYLDSAIESILSQSFKNFELIIINDGSTDDSYLILEKLNDPRVRIIAQENQGLSKTLNVAISLCQGEFIARQDQDDISFLYRLQKQVEFLNANPDVGLVGTIAEIWVGDKKTDRLLDHPSDDVSIKFNLLFDNPFVHSSVMIRRSVFDQIGGYCEDKSRQPPEDYELWSRVAREFNVANLPEVLLAYREVPSSMSRTGLNPFLTRLINISAENIAWYSGRNINAPEVTALSKLAHGVYEGIPRGVSFSKIEILIRDAAKSIIDRSDVPSNALDQLIKMRIAMLQYHYYQYRTGGWVRKILGARLERYIKSLAKRVLSAIS